MHPPSFPNFFQLWCCMEFWTWVYQILCRALYTTNCFGTLFGPFFQFSIRGCGMFLSSATLGHFYSVPKVFPYVWKICMFVAILSLISWCFLLWIFLPGLSFWLFKYPGTPIQRISGDTWSFGVDLSLSFGFPGFSQMLKLCRLVVEILIFLINTLFYKIQT